MKWFLLLLMLIPFRVWPVPYSIEYPEVLQKAGVKKARCLFKDSRGLLWIGTENGLFRFDGTHADRLKHEAGSPVTLPHNTINTITEDGGHHIWVGTLNGLAEIDAGTLACHVYRRARHNIPEDFDNKVFIDKTNHVWAGNSTGLYLLDRQKDTFRQVWGNAKNSSAAYVNCLTEWKNDWLVAGTFDGAFLVGKKNFSVTRIALPIAGLTVMRAMADGKGRLWLTTWGEGCLYSDSTGQHFRTLKWESPAPHTVSNVVSGITQAGGDLWLSTLRGVYKIPGYLNSAEPYHPGKTIDGDDLGLNALLADDDQDIWLAGASVSRFFLGQPLFETFVPHLAGVVQDIQPMQFDGQAAVAVSAMYERSGLSIFSLNGKLLYRQPEQASLDASAVMGVAADKFGRYWMATFAGIKMQERLLLPSVKINNILISHDTVWVSRYKDGIGLLDLSGKKLRSFYPNDGSGLKDELINRFFADSKGRLWVGANQNLYLFHPCTGKFSAYNFNEPTLAFTVHDLAELPGGKLVIASNAGLFIFDPVSGAHKKISSATVHEDDIQSVCADSRGDLWYITNDQLVYYQVKPGHFMIFGAEDGLHTADDLAWLKSFDGRRFYLAEKNRLVSFDIENVKQNEKPAGLYIHTLQVNDSTLKTFSADSRQIDLDYRQTKVTIGFGAVNFLKPEQNLFHYRLSGVDENWITSPEPQVSYSNLSPGRYTFTLAAQNAAGLWSKPLRLVLLITPPYWRTWWFEGLSALALLAIVLIAVRYVVQRNLREQILKLEKEQAIEKERNRIARDMHDDLGSGLTKIAILSEVAKSGKTGAPGPLDVISATSRELVDNLQDIIWLLNPKNDSLESLALYIRRFVNGLFEPAGIIPAFDFPDEPGELALSEEQRRTIFLLVKENCNNIVKHAAATTVTIKLRTEDGILFFSIRDNGRGFDPNLVSALSNGLRNMQNRVSQAGGTYAVFSAPGQGTEISLTLKSHFLAIGRQG